MIHGVCKYVFVVRGQYPDKGEINTKFRHMRGSVDDQALRYIVARMGNTLYSEDGASKITAPVRNIIRNMRVYLEWVYAHTPRPVKRI